MQYKLENGGMSVLIDALGAEPVSLLFRGRERLWQNENGSWAGHAPVLFPVCGNCAMRLGGTSYPLPRHGFARKMPFALVSQTKDSISLALRSSKETLRQYPFAFVFTVTYRLEGDTLSICYEAENPDGKQMYFSWGGHLSHALFAPISQHGLRFPAEERLVALLHDGEGRLTGREKKYGVGKEFRLPEEDLQGGNTLIFAPASREVTLCNGERSLAKVEFGGFPYLLLWRPEGARMLCIEPWGNLPDRAGEELSFPQKAGILRLAGGQRARIFQKITYFEV